MLNSIAPLIGMVVLALAGCGEMATLPVSAGTGPQPARPPPQQTLIPTVHIAPAVGWPAGMRPHAAAGTSVAEFARGLDHPRWLYVLPNGDVLVAETNAPPRPDDGKGIKSWLMGLFKKGAGAGVPSANRIALLRDTDGDGVADLRSVLLEGLNSPFGMALVGDNLYVANSDAVLRFPYAAGDTRITLPAPFINGMFIGQHGSWNRRPHSGYKVIFVPFEGGKPGGAPVDVLTGFLSEEGNAYGRPVGVVLDKHGALLVADDVGNVVWRVTARR